MKLSGIQKAALKALSEKPCGEASAYDLKMSTGFVVSTRTMSALSSRRLAYLINAPGNMTFPQNAIYRITEIGRIVAEAGDAK